MCYSLDVFLSPHTGLCPDPNESKSSVTPWGEGLNGEMQVLERCQVVMEGWELT